MTEKKRGGLTRGDPRGGLTEAGTSGLSGDAAAPPAREAIVPQAFKDLIMKPEELRKMQVLLTEDRFGQTLKLLGLEGHRAEILSGTFAADELAASLDRALAFYDQQQRANRPHLKLEVLRRDTPLVIGWIDEIRRLRGELSRDRTSGISEFSKLIQAETRRLRRYDARDELKTLTEYNTLTSSSWEKIKAKYSDAFSAVDLIALAQELFGASWRPPLPTAPPQAGADDVERWIAFVDDDETYRVFSEFGAVTERDLVRRQVSDVSGRVAKIKAKWEEAAKRNRRLQNYRDKRKKFGKWLAQLDSIAAAPPTEVATRVSKWIADEQFTRFRSRLISDVRRHYRDDGRIDFGEWTLLVDQGERFFKEASRGALGAEDRRTCEQWLIGLCREETKDPNWAPPPDPEIELQARLADAQREQHRARERQEEAVAMAAQLAAEKKRLEEERQRVSLVHAEQSEHARELAERASKVEFAAESLRHRNSATPPSLAKGGIVGGILGIVATLVIGAVGGHSCSSESRMALAESRAPLAASADPDALSLACATRTQREAKARELSESLKQTVTAIRPATAASAVTERGAGCLSAQQQGGTKSP